jgi:hypothetical protein
VAGAGGGQGEHGFPADDVLVAWLPELVEEHEVEGLGPVGAAAILAAVLRARTAAAEAQLTFAAGMPKVSVPGRDGADSAAAVVADTKAVAAGKPAAKLAALIAEQPSSTATGMPRRCMRTSW